MVASGALFLWVLLRAQRGPRVELPPYRFSAPVHAVASVPKALNGFAVWVTLMVALTVANYGVPIFHLMTQKTNVPAVFSH
jgi:cytochrome c oxidase subunit 1